MNAREKLLERAVEAVHRGAQVVVHHRGSVASRSAHHKGEPGSWNPVTEVDRESEAVITAFLREAGPEFQFLGEENIAGQVEEAEHLWIVDPIDGTVNYMHGIPHFGISVGYAHHGIMQVAACLDPVRQELFTAMRGAGAWLNGESISVSSTDRLDEALIATGFYYDRGSMMEHTLEVIRQLFRRRIRGIRRNGSSVLDMCWTAAGRTDAFFEFSLGPWDFGPASLVLEEAGGRATRDDGSPLQLTSGPVVAAAPGIHAALLEVIRQTGTSSGR